MTLGVAAVVLGGAAVRIGIGGGGVGALSAAVMAVLLVAGGWAAARLLSGPRAAASAAVVMIVLFDLAGFPTRNPPEYDDLEALYGADQQLSVRLASSPDTAPMITVVAQAVFAGAQPNFGIGGTINGTPVGWNCGFTHGVQRVALPVPRGVLTAGSSADVTLQLTGFPSRESEYLVVYASSKHGGTLISLEPAATVSQNATVCSVV